MTARTQWLFRGMYRGLTLATLSLLLASCTAQDPGLFDTPEAAMQTVAGLIGKGDEEQVEAIFGPGSVDLFRSGDHEADRADVKRVKGMIKVGLEFEDFDENTKIALLGDEAWPWPIPLVRDSAGWRFDTAAGREELLNRRIGRNELWTLSALHEIVDAQHEYRSQVWDGNPPAYAHRFRSTDGKHDGLYWPLEDGVERSPLGDLLAESEAEAKGPEPHPFNGYFFRMLSSRGPSAPGGALDYVDTEGRLTGGFAVIAWPAKYGNSGVMTFITNRRGMIYQKDLGPGTGQVVDDIQAYDPGPGWAPTGDGITAADPR